MTNYVSRIRSLAIGHLNCSLDDKNALHVPSDLKPGTYRWYLYYFSNLYKKGKDKINALDKKMFIEIFNTFKFEHTISWTRDTLIELEEDKKEDIKRCILDNIKYTESFFALKVNLHLLRCLEKDWYCADTFILEHSGNLKEFVKHA